LSPATLLRTLKARRCTVEVKPGGHLYVIRRDGRVLEFWPKTATWKERRMATTPANLQLSAKNKGKGVESLLEALPEAST
jgi:hypothetical protein